MHKLWKFAFFWKHEKNYEKVDKNISKNKNKTLRNRNTSLTYARGGNECSLSIVWP